MSRYYDKEGKKYPSVTTIISDCSNNSGALTQWSANMVVEWIKQNCEMSASYYIVHPEELDEARMEFRAVSQKALSIGSEVHSAIEMYLQGQDYTLTTKRAKRAFKAFLEWKEEVKLRPVDLEHTVWGERTAGTLDFAGYYKDKFYVIDWKTSKSFYPEMNYQAAIYRDAYQKNSRTIVEGCGILRLDKEFGFPEFKDTSKSYEKDLAVFKAMVELFYLRHPRISAKFNEK